MAISRSQQPRQMYGLGSFVKKITRKVTKPVTKVAQKLVPKEIAGIMRVAAPFLPPGYREAAYLLGTAKQTGRISPVDLALVSVPYLNKAAGKTDAGFFAEQFPRANQFLFGAPEVTARGDLITTTKGVPQLGIADTTTTLPGFGAERVVSGETTGILGTGGKMFQFGKDAGPAAFRDQTKLGSFLLGDEEGGFSKSKLAGIGIGTLSLIQNAKTPDEAGTALAEATGNSDDYERGVQLFSQLPQGIFDIPEQFRLQSKDGGLMRTNYARGSESITRKPDFFKDLFLDREGGGGRDYMLPDEASERTFSEIFTMGSDDMRKAEEIEAERIFPSIYNKAMRVIDAIQDIDDEKTRMKIIDDVNKSFNEKEGFGLSKPANHYYNIIQKYGYLLDEDKGLGSMQARKANGGRANFALGTMPTAQESGLGGLPIEADMRYTGGFMPYGAKEKADDVPARLSKNEFVFTADAVRAAGGGSVNEGAKKMYQTMKQLEAKPEAKGMMA